MVRFIITENLSLTTHADYLSALTAVRALSLLAIFHLSIGPGDEGTLGFALTSQAVQASLQVSRLFSLTSLNSSSGNFILLDELASRSFATENALFVPRG